MKTDMILVAVPAELLAEADIDVCDTLEMFAVDGMLVIRQAEEECDLCPCCHCRENSLLLFRMAALFSGAVCFTLLLYSRKKNPIYHFNHERKNEK